ncbi:GNAT family N-acetyltransferase [Actinomadura luteofluorescens]|uniref:GNAT family N-acetyltransferase n=1 Tax=Actinomadura luteofluorescens TaxID=46163 RepID=UPI00362F876D
MVRTRRDDAEWHVGRLGVVPDLRGRGLGRWLLQTAEAAADPACRRIVLSTGAGSRNNIALYRSEGYQPAPSPARTAPSASPRSPQHPSRDRAGCGAGSGRVRPDLTVSKTTRVS